jgi:hypothetical protein
MMLRTLKILFLISLISCSNTKNRESEWIVLDIKDKNCEVSFPFDKYKTHKEEYYAESIGKIYSCEYDLNTQNLNDKNVAYKITIYDYPEFNFNDSQVIDEFLSEVAENILISFNASRLSERKININGYPGKELYYYMASQGAYFTTRMYIIDGKQYSLTVITDKNNLFNQLIINFFDSFKLYPNLNE